MDTRQIKQDLKGFISIGDLDDGTILEVVNEGRKDNIKDRDGKDKLVFKLGVKTPNGSETEAAINWTTFDDLEAAFGNETREWIGKKVEVYHVQQMAFGKVAQVGLLRPQGAKPTEKGKKGK